MNPKVKKDWIESLLSKEYPQGQGKLRYEQDDINYYCCLGVLTDLYIKEHKDAEWETSFNSFNNITIYMYKHTTGVLHPDICKWAGIESDNATLPDNTRIDTRVGSATALTELNDDGKTFKEIVEIIEEYF